MLTGMFCAVRAWACYSSQQCCASKDGRSRLSWNEPTWSQFTCSARDSEEQHGQRPRSQRRDHFRRARGRGGFRLFGPLLCVRATHRIGAVWHPCRGWGGRGFRAIGFRDLTLGVYVSALAWWSCRRALSIVLGATVIIPICDLVLLASIGFNWHLIVHAASAAYFTAL